MCGIVGYIGPSLAAPIVLEGLRQLEYRGYDSAGMAVVDPDGAIQVRREAGKLVNLEQALYLDPLLGNTGIGHTRWATHGPPSQRNAHPHRSPDNRLVVVQNGIVENFLALRQMLQGEGYVFRERHGHRGDRAPGPSPLQQRQRRGSGPGRAPGPEHAAWSQRSGGVEPGFPRSADRRPLGQCGGRGRGPGRRGELHRQRHPGHPAPHPQDGLSGKPPDGRGHRREASTIMDLQGSRWRSDRYRSTGTPSPRRRASTATSCRKRSTSRGAASPTPCAAAWTLRITEWCWTAST